MIIHVGGKKKKGGKKTNSIKGHTGPGEVAQASNPSTLGGRRITKSAVGDQPGQHDKTPFLLKIEKLARCGGWSQ